MRRLRPFRPLAILYLVLLVGCAEVRFISDYDPQTDDRLSALHQDVESLLTELEGTLGTPTGEFRQYEHRYDSLRVDLRTLAIRAESRPQNQIQVQQLAEVLRQLDLFAQVHRAGMQPEEIVPFREGFNQSFRAMITLELAKKRGADA